MKKKAFVVKQRNELVALLKSLSDKQWHNQTLCTGWSIEDLSAHLLVREHNIVAGIGLVIPQLADLHDKCMQKTRAKGHEYIIQKLKKYPWYMPASVNVAEFWVHNQDIVRGELKAPVPTLTLEEEMMLWQSLKGLVMVRKSMVRDLGSVVLENSQTKEQIHIEQKGSNKHTRVAGTAGELLLFFYGRRKAAKVHIQ